MKIRWIALEIYGRIRKSFSRSCIFLKFPFSINIKSNSVISNIPFELFKWKRKKDFQNVIHNLESTNSIAARRFDSRRIQSVIGTRVHGKSSDEYFHDSLFHRSVNFSLSQSVFGKTVQSGFLRIRKHSLMTRSQFTQSIIHREESVSGCSLFNYRAINRLPIETDRQVCARQDDTWVYFAGFLK